MLPKEIPEGIQEEQLGQLCFPPGKDLQLPWGIPSKKEAPSWDKIPVFWSRTCWDEIPGRSSGGFGNSTVQVWILWFFPGLIWEFIPFSWNSKWKLLENLGIKGTRRNFPWKQIRDD